MPRPKPRRRREEAAEEVFVRGGTSKLAGGRHHHVAEIYGDSVTVGLRPWARDRVLSMVSSR